jgi:predicted Zn finger-like uncharacterized protein
MSLATRCTHCGTIFKVVQDQLKVSEGWVRCGRCHEVFNALPTLFDLEKDPPPPRQQPQAEVAADPAPTPDAEPAPHQDADPAWADARPSEFPATAPAAFDPEPAAPSPAQTGHNDAPPETTPWPQPAADAGWSGQAETGFQSSSPDDSLARPKQDIPQHSPAEHVIPPEPSPGSALLAADDFDLDTAVGLNEGHQAPGQTQDAHGMQGGMPEFAATFTPQPDAPFEPAWEPAWESDQALADQPSPYPSSTARSDITDMGLTLSDEPRPWQQPPPFDEDLPSTDEADALDSRYLLPTPRERKPAYLRQRGPEFADAQFPTDALMDDEDEWGGAPPREPPASPMPGTTGSTRSPLGPPPRPMPVTGLRGAVQHEPGFPVEAPLAERDEVLSERADPPSGHDAIPTPQPSRFGEDFIPEMAVEPPSQRKGKPGARAAATPEFMRRAQRQAFWRHPATRAVMSVMALALLLSLGLQMAHQFRDLLAAYHPPLRPYLAQLCEVAGCTLQPPLSLDKLEVESATLVRATSEGPDRYRLAVVVHNKAPIDLAWPHVDLTLTDANGAVIARRAFSPDDADWIDTADAAADMPPHSGLTRSRPVAVPSARSTTLLWQLRAPQLQPAGYTAELFYP